MHDIPLEELKELLAARFDEVDLIEALNVDSEDIVNRFSDIIEENRERFLGMLEELDISEDYDNE